MVADLLGREAALAHELLDQRVIDGQPLELAVAQAVAARVADVDDRDARRSPTCAAVSVVPIPA